MTGEEHDTHDRASPFLLILARIAAVVGSMLADRTSQLVAMERLEVRRAAAVLALSFAAAVFACAAVGFGAYSILVALGEERRAVGAALIGACFALLSVLAILLARGRPGPR